MNPSTSVSVVRALRELDLTAVDAEELRARCKTRRRPS
jgi:hypothetical protein